MVWLNVMTTTAKIIAVMIMYGINRPKPKPNPNLNDVLKLTSSFVSLSLSKVFHRHSLSYPRI